MTGGTSMGGPRAQVDDVVRLDPRSSEGPRARARVLPEPPGRVVRDA
jgi:hypothetical protein